MIAYVDEYGQLSSTPPDPTRTKTVKSDDIQIGIPRQPPGDYADVLRKGTITFFNQSKGYGFIKDQDSHESIFVHINAMEDELKENDKVTFEIGKGAKGPVALKVKNA
jgi:cold shock CspA family protein